MGQFIFGLFAGIVVGLVMEWVIDWAGLFPGRPVDASAHLQASPKVKSKLARTAGRLHQDSTSNQTSPDTSRD